MKVFLAAVAVAAAFALPHPAAAAPPARGSTLVVLGDSFAANAVHWDAAECVRGATSWPTQLSRLLGVAGTPDFLDESCAGAALESATGYTPALEAVEADRAGGFGPETALVAIQFGFNDAWGSENPKTLWGSLVSCVYNLVDGCDREAAAQGRITDFRAVSGPAYAERIEQVVRYLRYYAPAARIVLVGYPELFPPGDTVCLNVLGVADFTQPRGGAVTEYLNRLDTAQREAAALLGTDFFDTRALTAGHGLCSPEPWVNGTLDPRADLTGIPFHPSARGDAVLAAALHERYGSRR
ncbi:SGNH/GDSL hydrolase family protein [Nocardia asteroides]|uniref:SGNH/GDSL hydrolase family protein n=1 Tax=Nocardia asteroides TaxID=1824 RepID=UPI001E318460|nr:SGNH/GDSL hydrolase family protein [Nocardia asteroides]UGT61214.1 SGNH/GDSL hydrolase family protein [Nocardia asteroides]